MSESESNSRRLEHLRALLDERGIEPNQDYDYEGLMAAIAGDSPCPRYAAITYDETYTFVDLYETAEAACSYLAEKLGDEVGGSIEAVVDLETGAYQRAEAQVTVTLAKAEPRP